MLRRGFKTWCENISLQLRGDLGLTKTEPLAAQALARWMKVPLWAPADVVGLSPDVVRILVTEEAANWSAVTVSAGTKHAVIYNPTHSPRRQSSDVMHELAHMLIDHEPARMILSADGKQGLRSFDRTQEDEASWLAGCLLLPRPALLAIATKGTSAEAACEKYGVSRDLFNYRLNVTGVNVQVKRKRKSRA